YVFCLHVFLFYLFIYLCLVYFVDSLFLLSITFPLYESSKILTSLVLLFCLFLLLTYTVLRVKETSFFVHFHGGLVAVLKLLHSLCVSDTSTATAMIGFRERERTRERRLSWARLAIFVLWVILVFSLISLFFSMDKESKTTTTSSTPTPRTRTTHLLKQRSFSRILFHTPSSSSSSSSRSYYPQQKSKVVERDPHPTNIYGDDKRIIHTGPNPLHN
ncbi:hypothetical protein V8G54_002961, partial [Vigna mungo]